MMISPSSNIHFITLIFTLFLFYSPMDAYANDHFEVFDSQTYLELEDMDNPNGYFADVNQYDQTDRGMQLNMQGSSYNKYDSAPIIATDAADNPYLVSRVFSEIGFTLLYDAAVIGIGAGIISVAMNNSTSLENFFDSTAGVFALGAGCLLVTPGLAIHTSHALLDGRGRVGLGYAGSAIGTIAGIALGSVGFISNSIAGYLLSLSIGAIGGLVGGITWYEISDRKARETSYFSVQNLHPVIDITSERSVFGVGFQF